MTKFLQESLVNILGMLASRHTTNAAACLLDLSIELTEHPPLHQNALHQLTLNFAIRGTGSLFGLGA